MVIERIEVFVVRLRYSEPFTISAGTSVQKTNVEVKLIDDQGIIGWGEASPSRRVMGETEETVLDALRKLCPALIGAPAVIEDAVRLMDRAVPSSLSAKAALDMAVHDIMGKVEGRPVWRILGGARDRVVTDLSLGIKSPKEMALDALAAVAKGFGILKVKVGQDPNTDVERVEAIRSAIGGDMTIRIDANRGWNVRQALKALREMEKFNIEFVEEPIKKGEIGGLRKIRQGTSIPVMADESVLSLEDARMLIGQEAVDMFNIKLMKCGGLLKGARIESLAKDAGLPCMIGCIGESEIGVQAAVHFGAALKGVIHADLDCDLLSRDHLVTGGIGPSRGPVRFPGDSPGFGELMLDEKLLGVPVAAFGSRV